MARQKNSSETTLDDVIKSVDRLAMIELVRSGATRTQVREVMGSISNETFAKINQALKKASSEKRNEE